MSFLYEQYVQHHELGQRALSDGRNDDARRELLLAARCILRLAQESQDEEMSAARKQKGMKLLALAQSIGDGSSGRGRGGAGGAAKSNGSSGRGNNSENASARPLETGTSSTGEETGKKWEYVEKPNVHFQDIAGLDEVKNVIRRRILYPFQNPDLAAKYGRKAGGGVLMYGPPGTGKTMMAKAIATELDAPFYNVLCSDIMSKWVGEAEQNLRELMATARARTPAVIFFDETEALIAKRGGNSTVMNRLIPEFLAQIDGVTTNGKGLLLLGATNRPWDLDPAAMRPGRFGEHIYIRLPDLAARRFLFDRTLGRVPLEPDVDLDEIARRSEGYSGADINGLVDRMIDPAFDQAMTSGNPVAVTRAHVERALGMSRPSVSPKELARYEKFHTSGE